MDQVDQSFRRKSTTAGSGRCACIPLKVAKDSVERERGERVAGGSHTRTCTSTVLECEDSVTRQRPRGYLVIRPVRVQGVNVTAQLAEHDPKIERVGHMYCLLGFNILGYCTCPGFSKAHRPNLPKTSKYCTFSQVRCSKYIFQVSNPNLE